MMFLIRVILCMFFTQIVQSDLIFRIIVVDQYSVFNFDVFYKSFLDSKVSDLNLETRLTQRCSHEACPALSCPGGNYTFFATQSCEGRGERINDPNQYTYVEYKMQDKVSMAATFLTREFDAANRLINIKDQHASITHSDIVGWNGVSQSPVAGKAKTDDSIFNKPWFWAVLIVPNVLILLCCLYFCCWRKKKSNENEYDQQAKSVSSSQFSPSPSPMAVYNPSHAVGDRVEVFYNGEWLPATVVTGDSFTGYGVLWEDGSHTSNVHSTDVRPYNGFAKPVPSPVEIHEKKRSSPSRNPIADYSPGESVIVNYQGSWLPASVVEGSTYNGYGVRWPDGTFSAGISHNDIRTANEEITASGRDSVRSDGKW